MTASELSSSVPCSQKPGMSQGTLNSLYAQQRCWFDSAWPEVTLPVLHCRWVAALPQQGGTHPMLAREAEERENTSCAREGGREGRDRAAFLAQPPSKVIWGHQKAPLKCALLKQ